jgi:hypothetical protein
VDDVFNDPERYARVYSLAKRLIALRELVLEKLSSRKYRRVVFGR